MVWLGPNDGNTFRDRYLNDSHSKNGKKKTLRSHFFNVKICHFLKNYPLTIIITSTFVINFWQSNLWNVPTGETSSGISIPRWIWIEWQIFWRCFHCKFTVLHFFSSEPIKVVSSTLHKFFLFLGGARSYFLLHCTTLVMTFGNNLFCLLHWNDHPFDNTQTQCFWIFLYIRWCLLTRSQIKVKEALSRSTVVANFGKFYSNNLK